VALLLIYCNVAALQWIADNACHKGDQLTIWHIDPEPYTPTAPTRRPGTPERTRQRKTHASGLASLPIALKQVGLMLRPEIRAIPG